MSIGTLTLIAGFIATMSGVLLNYFRINKVAKDNEYRHVINTQRLENTEFKKEITNLYDKIDKLNEVIREFDKALLISNAVSLSFPFPFWYKDHEGRMLMLNEEFCSTFKRCRTDYIGKTDFEVWDEDSAQKFKLSDSQTMSSKEGFMVNINEELDNHLVVKWKIPGVVSGDDYIAGIAIPYNLNKNVNKNK